MTDQKKVVVLGAGIGGLSAGYFLARTGRYDVTVLEKAPVTGGLCASFDYQDFRLDYGAHKIYSVIPGVLDEIEALMGDDLIKIEKKNRLYLQGHLVDYPLKLGNLASVLGLGKFLKIGLGYALELIAGALKRDEPGSYEDYMIRRFGRPAYELVFGPLADKVWGDPAGLHPEMARTRVPVSGGMDVILKLLGLKKETAETSAEFFFYPRRGFGDFPETMKAKIEAAGCRVLVNSDVREIDLHDGKVKAVSGTIEGNPFEFSTDYLVSSIPLPVLGNLLFGDTDSSFVQVVHELQFRHLVLVYVFVDRPLVMEDQWVFFPEKDYIFSRIFEQKQMNPQLGPENQTAICCDFTCDENSWQWQATDEELAQKTIEGLIKTGFVKPGQTQNTLVKRVRNFYPRYDLKYVQKMQMVNAKLKNAQNLLLTGRIGMYNYNNSDHCVDMGCFIAENLTQGLAPIHIWNQLEERVANYKIVD